MSEANEITFFAETNFRNQRKRFGIKTADRRKHTYIIGKTGMGKTTLLENMAIQDITSGKGLGIVDPHGEFAEKMLTFVPKERIDDVIYFNPSDTRFPIAFNPMEKVALNQRHLVASGLLGVFKKIWPDVWSPRMEYLLSNAILSLLEIPGSTLLGINRMFAEKDFRKKIVAQLTDPVIKAFWEKEYAQYQERFATEASAAIQNKVGQFISNPLIRNIVGQETSSFDLRKIMDEGKILIMNLSKGKIGEENSRLLGAMLVTKIYLTAMTRVDISREEDRRDFYLYVDEFQNFATESFASILSEARKYRLNLTLAHQYVAQMDETVQDAVFGNVGSMISFRVGAQDAELLEKEFSPEFMIQDLVNLGFAQIYLKLMIDGVASRPFSATTLAPYPVPQDNFKAEITRKSEEKYGTEQIKVEEGIAEYFAKDKENKAVFEPAKTEVKNEEGFRERRYGDGSASVRSREPAKKLFEANCIVDGKKILVPFEPDSRRPVYCQEHLELLKAGKLEKPPEQRIQDARQIIPERVQWNSERVQHEDSSAYGSGARISRDGGRSRASPGADRPRVFEKRSFAPPPVPPQVRREFVMRNVDSIRPMSLRELPKKENKEINLSELRAILEESIKNKETEKNPEPQVRTMPEGSPQRKMSGVIRPGESVKF